MWILKPGHKIKTFEGAEAEVLSETEDGEWIRIRYLDDQDDPLFTGTEDLAHRDEVEMLLGVAHKGSWGDRVTVVVHHVPESETRNCCSSPTQHAPLRRWIASDPRSVARYTLCSAFV